MQTSIILFFVVWLVVFLSDIVLIVRKSPRPLSVQQKLGLTICAIALVGSLTLPITSVMGVVNNGLTDTFKLLMEQSKQETSILCEYNYFAPIVLAFLLLAPILSAAMTINNIGRRAAGLLLLIVPLYLSLLFVTCTPLKTISLAAGSYTSLAAGVAMLVLPWLQKDDRKCDNRNVMILLIIVLTVVGLLPAFCLQGALLADGSDSGKYDIGYSYDDGAVEQVPSESVEPEDDAYVADVSTTDTEDFMDSNINHTASFDFSQLDYTGAVYEYHGSNAAIIQVVEDHGEMVVRATRKGNSGTAYLESSTLFDAVYDGMEYCGELVFGQYDFDGNGNDELIIATRSLNEAAINYVNINVYRMSDMLCWTVEMPHDDDGNKAFCNPVLRVNKGELIVKDLCNKANSIIFSVSDRLFQ